MEALGTALLLQNLQLNYWAITSLCKLLKIETVQVVKLMLTGLAVSSYGQLVRYSWLYSNLIASLSNENIWKARGYWGQGVGVKILWTDKDGAVSTELELLMLLMLYLYCDYFGIQQSKGTFYKLSSYRWKKEVFSGSIGHGCKLDRQFSNIPVYLVPLETSDQVQIRCFQE